MKNILITGVNGAVGKALRQKFLREGYCVLGLDSKDAEPEENQQNSPYHFFRTDISDPKAVRDLVLLMKEKNLLPHTLILAAAVHLEDNAPYPDVQAFSESVNVNILGNMILLSEFMPVLEKNAVFIFLGSGVIYFPNPAYLGYFSSKIVITRIFDLFNSRYYSQGFLFKSIILGPLQSPMLSKSTPPSGIARFLRDLTTGSIDELSEKIFLFSENKKKRLYYRKLSMIVLWLSWIAQFLLPPKFKFYQVRL